MENTLEILLVYNYRIKYEFDSNAKTFFSKNRDSDSRNDFKVLSKQKKIVVTFDMHVCQKVS